MKALILSSVALLCGMGLVAQSPFVVKSTKMTVDGTSTMHKWEMAVNKVTAEGKLTMNGNVLEGIQSLNVTASAKSLKSEHGKIMDEKTYEALKADAHPNILFQLTEIESITPAGSGYTVKAKGNLTIAGVKKPVSMQVTASVAANGYITFKGSRKVSMLDHGMTPPKAVMGTIKVGPEVNVNFEVTLAPAAL
ncbi:MAG: YceI family protein [Haliscomenobacter sp.]|nr:YceI family protein [Haliscomenobacter sp.]MBK7477960.1 YceI family protein [Haliscomenobacter sp.]MBK8878251.1 YceI family protein [Haliscomenobacter sp.]